MSQLKFEIKEEAEREFYDIIDYYKQFDPSLPHDFIQEFENAVQHVMDFPNSGHPYLHQTKRIFLNRFPYAIVYKYYDNNLIIAFAIVHMKRKPGYWNKRTK